MPFQSGKETIRHPLHLEEMLTLSEVWAETLHVMKQFD